MDKQAADPAAKAGKQRFLLAVNYQPSIGLSRADNEWLRQTARLNIMVEEKPQHKSNGKAVQCLAYRHTLYRKTSVTKRQ